MSDVEGDDVPTPVVVAVVPTGPMDKDTAIKEVLKAARIHDGLARGLRETVKALDKRQAHLCILADDCDEPTYKKLVQALCQEHNIPLLTVDDKFQLGEWAGICKLDPEGKARKVVKCSSVAIRDWGKETPAHDVITEYIKSQKA